MQGFLVFVCIMQPPREEGKTGTGGVFVTPSEVELAKTGHARRATSTGESASLNPFVWQAEPDSQSFLAGVASTQPRPVFPSPTTMFAQSVFRFRINKVIGKRKSHILVSTDAVKGC